MSFPANSNLSAKDIQSNKATISNIRINDYDPTLTFYNQTQAIRQYYDFEHINVDRYTVNGRYAQTYLSTREINEKAISDTWLNRHIKYTHGYGVTMSQVDRITASGQGGWNVLTAVCLMVFCLLHHPCSTTIYTIYKETKSAKWMIEIGRASCRERV